MTRTDTIVASIYQQLQLIERHTEGGEGSVYYHPQKIFEQSLTEFLRLAAHWNEMCKSKSVQVPFFTLLFSDGRRPILLCASIGICPRMG